MSKLVAFLGICVFAQGCGRTRDLSRFSEDRSSLMIVQTFPSRGSEKVSKTSQIDLCLSSEIDPQSFVPTNVTLSSGREYVEIDVFIQLFPWFGPASKFQLSETRWCSGSVISIVPQVPLAPTTLYRVSLRPELARGWEGEAFDSTGPGWQKNSEGEDIFVVEFTTSEQSLHPEEQQPAKVMLRQLFAAGQVFDPNSSTCSCHRQADELAHELLDLSTPETAFTGFLNRSELESTGYPMVSPGNPSESYLIQKLVPTKENMPLWGVHGDLMPQDGELTHSDRVAIAWWIASGAMF